MRSEKGRRHVWGPEGLFLCHLFPWSKKFSLCLSSSQLGFVVICTHKNSGSYNTQTKVSYSLTFSDNLGLTLGSKHSHPSSYPTQSPQHPPLLFHVTKERFHLGLQAAKGWGSPSQGGRRLHDRRRGRKRNADGLLAEGKREPPSTLAG